MNYTQNDAHADDPTLWFSGDWEWSSIFECYENAFRAVRFGEPWNGFARPVVSTRVMEALVAREQMLVAAGETVDYWRWDGNGVIVISSDADPSDESEATWLLPDEDGNFDLAPLGYTFERLDPDTRVIRRIGL